MAILTDKNSQPVYTSQASDPFARNQNNTDQISSAGSLAAGDRVRVQQIGEAAVRPNIDRTTGDNFSKLSGSHAANEPRFSRPAESEGNGSPRTHASASQWVAPDRSSGNLAFVAAPVVPELTSPRIALETGSTRAAVVRNDDEPKRNDTARQPWTAVNHVEVTDRLAATPSPIAQPQQQIITPEQRVSAVYEVLEKNPFAKHAVTSETIQPLGLQTEAPCSVMLIRVGSSHGPSVGGIPIDLLPRIFSHHEISAALGVKAVCVVELTGAELAKPNMTPLEREQVNRHAFGVMRLIERLKCDGLQSLEVILDTDLMASREFAQAKQDLRPWKHVTYPRAFTEACLIEAVRQIEKTDGAQIQSWTSAESIAQVRLIKQGSLPNQNLVRHGGEHPFEVLVAAAPEKFSFAFMQAGRSFVEAPGFANPDVVIPATRLPYGAFQVSADNHRILLSCPNEAALQKHFPDLFDANLPLPQLKLQLAYQKYFANIGPYLNKHIDGLIPESPDASNERMAMRLVQECRTRLRNRPSKESEAQVKTATLAAGTVQNQIIQHTIRHLIAEYSSQVGHVGPQTNRHSISVPGLSANTEALYPSLDEGTFLEEAPQVSKVRGTRSLNTSFRGKGLQSKVSAVNPAHEDPLAPAVHDSSDTPPGDSDNDDSFSA